jgi:hypothetical protein
MEDVKTNGESIKVEAGAGITRMPGVEPPVETKVKLRTPLKTPDGRVFEELDVDLDKLTLGDLHNLEMEYAALFPGITPTNGVFMTDSKYQSLVIARINGLIYDQLRALGVRDAFNVSNRMGRFLSEIA